MSFAVVVPFVLWRFDLAKNTRAELLVGFIPLTLAGTPLGSFLQDYTPVNVLKIVVGSISIIVAVKEIYYNIKRQCCAPPPPEMEDIEAAEESVIPNLHVEFEVSEIPESRRVSSITAPDMRKISQISSPGLRKVSQTAAPKTRKVAHISTPEVTISTPEIEEEPQDSTTQIETISEIPTPEIRKVSILETRKISSAEKSRKISQTSAIRKISQVSAVRKISRISAGNLKFEEFKFQEELEQEDKGCCNKLGIRMKQSLAIVWPIRAVFVWMMVTGLLGGVLGGLVGARGIPFIVFFFMFEYPQEEIKANATIVAAINVAIRVITYISKAPPQDYPYRSWFNREDLYLYLCVTLIGTLGMPLGLWITRHIKQEHFKLGLALLLTVNGVSMVVMGGLHV